MRGCGGVFESAAVFDYFFEGNAGPFGGSDGTFSPLEILSAKVEFEMKFTYRCIDELISVSRVLMDLFDSSRT